jgi:CRP/FNR family transcriptional regulator, cyclic AMP receptor protein
MARTKIEVSDKAALLGSHPFFRSLRPDLLKRLADYAKVRVVKRGTTIFAKGDTGTSLFAVSSGMVQMITPSAEGKSAVFNLIGEGEIFGEIALLDGKARTADAIAFTDCALMTIERRDFIPLLRSFPDVTIAVIEVLCSRLRRTTQQVEDLLFLDLKSRLAKSLLRLSDVATPPGRIAISQNELSQIVGMSREMINKQLRIWARKGWITLQRKDITVLRRDALARILQDE